jgi:hypothetical protein
MTMLDNTGTLRKVIGRMKCAIVGVLAGPFAEVAAIGSRTKTNMRWQALITWEFPRLCRGGIKSLTYPGV